MGLILQNLVTYLNVHCTAETQKQPVSGGKPPEGRPFRIWYPLEISMENKINIVKFHNDVNQVAFTGFTKREMSIFYALAKILDDKNDQEISISFSQLQKIMSMRFEDAATFTTMLSDTAEKLLSIRATIKKDNGRIIAFVPFVLFDINPEQKYMRIRMNPEYTYLFNMLTKNFTYFELAEFNRLRTKYSQRLFSLLKQYRSTGRLYISVEDFKRLLDIPAAYTQKLIGTKILTPAMTELKKSFVDLELRKQKNGRTIVAYEFTFRPERQTIDAVAGSEESQGAGDKVFCPHCGKEMVLRKNKDTGTAFWGHKYYKNTKCTCTYSSLEELEKDRSEIEAAQAEAEEKKDEAGKAWANVLQQQQNLFKKVQKK